MGGLGERTPDNFKTFDFFDEDRGLATSAKTLETRAPGY
ncbi:MAG: endonuclease toxin domain-containing protein, partial [Paracoccus sp. (in: a-proteobacteria)]